jgi:Spy/CpxP family protein refolding chaperone
MKKRTIWISAIVVVVAMSAVPLAFAQRARAMHAHGEFGSTMFRHLEQAKAALDLSDQQVSDIKAAFQTLHAQNAPYRDSVRGGMQQVVQALINNPNDIAGAQALLDRQTDAERAMKANVVVAASKALNVLTPDQRTKLGTLMQERAARRQAR